MIMIGVFIITIIKTKSQYKKLNYIDLLKVYNSYHSKIFDLLLYANMLLVLKLFVTFYIKYSYTALNDILR